MNKHFTLLFLLILPLFLFAQHYKVSDLSAEIQDSIIVVHFNLVAKEPVDLGLFCKKDSLGIWLVCKAISGDIENQTSGNKTIFWEYFKDGLLEEDALQKKLFFGIKEEEITYAAQRVLEAKEKAKQIKKEKRDAIRQRMREEAAIANQNLNGHYIGLGSSVTSSGYYGGTIGLSYEYRFSFLGANIALGYGSSKKNYWRYFESFNVNLGLKLYVTHNKKILRNIYFNIIPLCFFGQEELHTVSYSVGNKNNILQTDDYKFNQLWGYGALFGFSPVWHLNKKIAFGFNADVGIKGNYKFNNWCPINWDLGFLIKF